MPSTRLQRQWRAELNRTWRDLEQQCSGKLGRKFRIASNVRRAVEHELESDFKDELGDIANLISEGKAETARDELAEVVRDSREIAEKHVGYIALQVAAMDATPRAEKLSRAVKARGREKRGRYGKSFEEALTVFSFVADERFDFLTMLRRKISLYGRIPWQELCAKWNAKYPDRQKTPQTLQRDYYRYRRDKYLRETFFDRKLAEIKAKWSPLRWTVIEDTAERVVFGLDVLED
jgi:hypothetical protein